MKSDGQLGRNFLRGTEGDAANVILAAAGHNLRLLRTWLACLLACLIRLLVAACRAGPAHSPQPIGS
jgi:IS5 family transposase